MERTFTYLLMGCSYEQMICNGIGDYYSGDVLEAFVSMEEQAFDKNSLYAFGWEELMLRISPVQLTKDWDPRHLLKSLFEALNISPSWENQELVDNLPTIIIYDENQVEQLLINWKLNPIENNDVDKVRFCDVLRETLEIAFEAKKGIIFIGEWGFDYDINYKYLLDKKELLEASGMVYTDRHA